MHKRTPSHIKLVLSMVGLVVFALGLLTFILMLRVQEPLRMLAVTSLASVSKTLERSLELNNDAYEAKNEEERRKVLRENLRELILGANIEGRGYAYVFNSKGEFIIHPDQTLEGASILDYAFGRDILAAREGVFSYDWKGQRKTVNLNYFEPLDWHVAIGMDDNEMLMGADKDVLYTAVGTSLLVLVVAVLLALLTVRGVTRPLTRLGIYTREVVKGNYQADIEYGAKDAILDTIDAVKAMVAELKRKLGFADGVLAGVTQPYLVLDKEGRIADLNEQLVRILEKSGEVETYKGRGVGEFFHGDASRASIAEQALSEHGKVQQEVNYTTQGGHPIVLHVSSIPIYDLDGELMGAFALYFDLTEIRNKEREIQNANDTIRRVAEEAERVSSNVASAAEELAAQVEQVSRGAELQHRRTTETATSMQQMTSAVLEVARSAGDASQSAEDARSKAQSGESVVGEMVTAINSIQEQTLQLQTNMDELGEQAESIGRIINVINDIADQTNLLALNAAIEAARAGEAGRGFAVVADEVRKLAEKTMDATKEVGQAIASIQSGTRRSLEAAQRTTETVAKSTQLANQSGLALKDIVSIVQGTAGQVSSIATASEQQSTASDEITRAIDDISRICDETSGGIDQSTSAITELARQAQQLNRIIEELRN